MTVNRPNANRFAATKCKTSKASFVTAWLFSSSLTNARQASDDRISVGRKCLRAKVLLPDPLESIKATRLSLGMAIVMRFNEERSQLVFTGGLGMPLPTRNSPYRNPFLMSPLHLVRQEMTYECHCNCS